MDQRTYTKDSRTISCAYVIEARVYCENPSEEFRPSPGLLQYVNLNSADYDWLRVDSWVRQRNFFVSPNLLVQIVFSCRSPLEQWSLRSLTLYSANSSLLDFPGNKHYRD